MEFFSIEHIAILAVLAIGLWTIYNGVFKGKIFIYILGSLDRRKEPLLFYPYFALWVIILVVVTLNLFGVDVFGAAHRWARASGISIPG